VLLSMALVGIRRQQAMLYIPATQKHRFAKTHTRLKASGSQSSSCSGMPRKSVTQSAVDTLPRMDTTTDLVSWSRATMYGSAPSACG